MQKGLRIHTHEDPRAGDTKAKGKRESAVRRGAARIGDRLLRSTAVACALLLGIMALKNADLPWTRAAAAGIERALTMRIDLDESIGRLYFVRELMPETALVFWNSGARESLREPVEGRIEHEWSARQPWRVYVCQPGAEVRAALSGEVKAVEKGAMADYLVLMEHEGGRGSVYAYLAETSVQPGDRLWAGDAIGRTGASEPSRLYFELREGENSVDPEGA